MKAFRLKESESETLNTYRMALEGIHASNDEWSRACTVLLRECEYLPTIARILEALARVRRETVNEASGWAWQLFKLNGRSFARRINLARPIPTAPPGAYDVHVRPDHEAHSEPCNRDEARAAFKAGWCESGASPAKADAMFERIDAAFSGSHRPRAERMVPALSDYDDSPAALAQAPPRKQIGPAPGAAAQPAHQAPDSRGWD
jgi:hypothetical protein